MIDPNQIDMKQLYQDSDPDHLHQLEMFVSKFKLKDNQKEKEI